MLPGWQFGALLPLLGTTPGTLLEPAKLRVQLALEAASSGATEKSGEKVLPSGLAAHVLPLRGRVSVRSEDGAAALRWKVELVADLMISCRTGIATISARAAEPTLSS